MAVSATTYFEVNGTGDNDNGGGFNSAGSSAGTDYSLQNTAQGSGTADMEMHATTNTKVKPATYSVAAGDVRNLVHIISGTSWTPGWYEITAQDGTYWTLDRSPAAAGLAYKSTWKMGGALDDIGGLGAAVTSINVANLGAFLKGDATITGAATNVAGGCLLTTVRLRIFGYATTRTVTNTDTPPKLTLAASVANAIILKTGISGTVYNVSLDGASNTSSQGVYGLHSINCVFANFTNNASASLVTGCLATGCSATYVFPNSAFFCVASENAVTPFSGNYCVGCIAESNSGASTDGFIGAFPMGCVSYNNGRDGFASASTGGISMANCIAEGNARYGFNVSASAILNNCAGYNNTSGNSLADIVMSPGYVAVTVGSVFTNAASGDFSLNNTASRGALLRAAGYPATFPAGTTASYRDIGAAQHADPAGDIKTINGIAISGISKLG